MKPKFSIITTCKGRLDHLKQSLPRMTEQPDAEVIVVDYSCPEGTAAYVTEHFPDVRVVRVEGESGFSNWRARNLGAREAQGEWLIFCDADTVLNSDATTWLAQNMPPRSIGHFNRAATTKFNTTKLRLGTNQLRGFHVVPAQAFERFDGYDDVLQGYAAGADTDLEVRLGLFGFKRVALSPSLVDSVIEHDNEERTKHHRMPIRTSYAAGYLYRKAKTAILRVRRVPSLKLDFRTRLYQAAVKAAETLGPEHPVISLKVDVENEGIGMPLQLGFRKARFRMKLEVTIEGMEPTDEIPSHL